MCSRVCVHGRPPISLAVHCTHTQREKRREREKGGEREKGRETETQRETDEWTDRQPDRHTD